MKCFSNFQGVMSCPECKGKLQVRISADDVSPPASVCATKLWHYKSQSIQIKNFSTIYNQRKPVLCLEIIKVYGWPMLIECSSLNEHILYMLCFLCLLMLINLTDSKMAIFCLPGKLVKSLLSIFFNRKFIFFVLITVYLMGLVMIFFRCTR